MKIQSILAGVAAFAAVALAAGAASASYVCSTYYTPSSSTAGSEGMLRAVVYSDPDCAGALVGSYTYCSTGGTSSNCPSNTSYRYDRASILALFDGFRHAAKDNQPVSIQVIACVSGATTCAGNTYFLAN